MVVIGADALCVSFFYRTDGPTKYLDGNQTSITMQSSTWAIVVIVAMVTLNLIRLALN